MNILDESRGPADVSRNEVAIYLKTAIRIFELQYFMGTISISQTATVMFTEK
jgi:hypothetical protein